jgi:selenocysteine-specific elongation factor
VRRLSNSVAAMNDSDDGRLHANPAAASGPTDQEREQFAIRNALEAAGILGADAAELAAATKLEGSRVELRLAELLAAGRVRQLNRPPAFIGADIGADVLTRAREYLRQRQRERPWLQGCTSIALAQELFVAENALVRVLAGFVETGQLAYREGYYATADFLPELRPDQRSFFAGAFEGAPPPAALLFAELVARVNDSPVPELRQAFETLVAGGALCRVGDFIYLGSRIAEIRVQLASALQERQTLSVAEFRTLTGTTRKYAVPLLEYFDAAGVTRRNGDVRVLRGEA